MSWASCFLCAILFIQFGGCTAVTVKVKYPKGDTVSSIKNKGNKVQNPVTNRGEIQPVSFPDSAENHPEGRTVLVSPLSQSPSSSLCLLEGKLDFNEVEKIAIDQKTDFWCWGAVAQMDIKFRNPEQNLTQCEIVTEVKHNGQTENGVPFCCKTPTDLSCLQNGRPEDVFNKFRFTFKTWEYDGALGVLLPEEIRGQLCNNGVFPHIVLNPDGGGHVVNVTGVTRVGNGYFVEIFDPLKKMFKTIPYQDFTEGYIGWGGVKFNIESALVLIEKAPVEGEIR